MYIIHNTLYAIIVLCQTPSVMLRAVGSLLIETLDNKTGWIVS